MSDDHRPWVLAIDVGTSSCRASVFDARGARVPDLGARREYTPQLLPNGGAVFDIDVLSQWVLESIDEVLTAAGPRASHVQLVATTAFWHSLVGVDEAGRALTPVYLWMDARSREHARVLKRRLDERAVHARTGCVLHWSYLPAKLTWLADTEPELYKAVHCWTSFGEYFVGRLTGQRCASISMASATGLFNQHLCQWDEEMLEALSLRRERLPVLSRDTHCWSGVLPEFARRWPALAQVPWFAPLGDGACSNVGAGCTTRERMALMVGTSGALRVLWRADKVEIPWGVWGYRLDAQRLVLGGALNDGGILAQWLRQSLSVAPPETLEAEMSRLEPDSHGLTVLPFWGGERSPGWASDARGAVLGLSLTTRPVHVFRAALEAIALRFARLEALLRGVVPEARVVVATGGGLLRSPGWMQIMADAMGRSVVASTEREASSRGAALWALERAGHLTMPLESVPPLSGQRFEPTPEATARYGAALERQEKLYALLVENGRLKV